MKKRSVFTVLVFTLALLTLAGVPSVSFADSGETVYVSQNGVTSGAQIGTQQYPYKNFTDAVAYAAGLGKDATVVILDRAEVPAKYSSPSFAGTITVRGGTLVTNNRLHLNGKFVFEHLCLSNNVALVIAAQGHKLVMGEGITVQGKEIYLVGGYENSLNKNSDIPATGYSTDITIRSGTYYAIGGGNRFLDGAYSGNIRVTLGKTNPSDTLAITSTLVTGSLNYDGGNHVFATMIFDGDVDSIQTYRPIGHAAAGVQGRFDVDVVVRGASVISTGSADLRGHDYTINVYADERVKGAMTFAASIVGQDNVQPYSRYCAKINGTHPDADGNRICDNCGAVTDCKHTNGEWRATEEATCKSRGQYVWFCYDCQRNIDGMTKTGDAFDMENHVGENFVWQAENGKFTCVCPTCKTKIERSDAPVLYVSKDGNDLFDGLSPQRAAASPASAVSRIANVGGTVAIVGTYNLTEDLILPEHAKPVTFRGYEPDNGDFPGGFYLPKATVISLGGDTVFDGICFSGSASLVFACNWNNAEFGRISVLNNTQATVVAGRYRITKDDAESKTSSVKITEGATPLVSKEGAFSKKRFYEEICLGSVFGASGISVSGKTVTFDARDADIGTLCAASAAKTYRDCSVSNCKTAVNLRGKTVIVTGCTVSGGTSDRAVLEKLTLGFFDNSYIGTAFDICNVGDTAITVSSGKDGRASPIGFPFTFSANGGFAENKTPIKVAVDYGTHSFSHSVPAPCVFKGEADAQKALSENKTDECVFHSKTTSPATPGQKGTRLFSCSCGRSYTEEYDYTCSEEGHLYTAVGDGTYTCSVCGQSFTKCYGENFFTATVNKTEADRTEATLFVKGSFAAALVSIRVPEGVTFDRIVLPENDLFTVKGRENGGEYLIAFLSKSGKTDAADLSLGILLKGAYKDGDVIAVSVPELYGENGEVLRATPISTVWKVTEFDPDALVTAPETKAPDTRSPVTGSSDTGEGTDTSDLPSGGSRKTAVAAAVGAVAAAGAAAAAALLLKKKKAKNGKDEK